MPRRHILTNDVHGTYIAIQHTKAVKSKTFVGLPQISTFGKYYCTLSFS